MPALFRLALTFALLAFAAATRAQLLDTTLTLGKKPDAVVLPVAVAAPGSYRLTITDFGGAGGPARLGRLDVAVTSGSTLVASAAVTAAGATATSNKTFSAAAGAHRVIIIGQPAAPATVGSAGVRIDDPVSGAVLLDTVQAFTVAAPATASPATFEHELAVTGAGSYVLETTDFALPQPLAALQTTVIRRSDGAVVANVAGPAQIILTAAGADVYETFVYAELAGGAQRGLVGVNLRDAITGAASFATVHELGAWPFTYPFDLNAGTTLSLAVNDLAFPLPLASVGAVLAHDGRLAAPPLSTSGSVAAPAAAGAYTVYADARPAAASPGSFGVMVSASGGTRFVERVQNVSLPGPVTDEGTVDASFDLVTAGNYTLALTDFGVAGFFDAFTSVALALTRDNAIVDTLDAPGNFQFAGTPGHYSLAILADPAGTHGAGLLGVEVRGAAGGAAVYENTAAVGASFISATVDVPTAQSINATLTDLAFPATFDEIKVAVTRGAARAGEIVGAGAFSFMATPGKYFVNLLATPDAQLGYGTLGLNVRATPAAPVVTLGASAATLPAGGSVTLTWSSTDAATCAASGGWSGARGKTGTTSVGPLSADTTFTLTCTGDGGSDAASVAVKITPEQRTGGGGAADTISLYALALALVAARIRRRRPGV